MKLFKRQPVEVLGNALKVGEKTESFTLTNQGLEDIHSNTLQAKYLILNVVPSLDTSVCNIQTRTVHQTLNDLKDALTITISNDLPFAQKRWCGQEGLSNIMTLSDYKHLDFAYKFGVLIKEHRLLARSVFVLDETRKVIYVEYVDNMSEEPNYDALFNFLEERDIK
jgi:thiol peroxidase